MGTVTETAVEPMLQADEVCLLHKRDRPDSRPDSHPDSRPSSTLGSCLG
ncbi:hypothetical protein [Thermoleptolyngbya sp.]